MTEQTGRGPEEDRMGESERAAYLRGRADEAALHPNGSCGCAGEGRCQWCRLMQTAEERDEARAEADRLLAVVACASRACAAALEPDLSHRSEAVTMRRMRELRRMIDALSGPRDEP